jgi:hypothetical protein
MQHGGTMGQPDESSGGEMGEEGEMERGMGQGGSEMEQEGEGSEERVERPEGNGELDMGDLEQEPEQQQMEACAVIVPEQRS